MEDAGAFIDIVKSYPILYDPDECEYRNFKKREELWAEVASKMNTDTPSVKKKWKNLRTSYGRYMRCKTTLKTFNTWQWGPKLELFLKPIQEKKSEKDDLEPSSILYNDQYVKMDHEMNYVNHASDLSDIESEELEPASVTLNKSQKNVDPNADMMMPDNIKLDCNDVVRNDDIANMDAMDFLFLSYAKTAKTFSLKRQAILKIRLAELMMNEEMEHIEESNLPENKHKAKKPHKRHINK